MNINPNSPAIDHQIDRLENQSFSSERTSFFGRLWKGITSCRCDCLKGEETTQIKTDFVAGKGFKHLQEELKTPQKPTIALSEKIFGRLEGENTKEKVDIKEILKLDKKSEDIGVVKTKQRKNAEILTVYQDSAISKKHPYQKSETIEDEEKYELEVRYSEGKAVILQQGPSGCTAASTAMLIQDAGNL